MKLERFRFRSPMPVCAVDAFNWHTRPGVFERIIPPWEPVRLLEHDGRLADGSRVVLAVRIGGIWRRWVAEHHDCRPGRQFCDVQTEGPFAHWRHCHRFIPQNKDCSYLEEEIEFALPGGRLGQLLGGAVTRRHLERLFRYRHAVTAADLQLHKKYSAHCPKSIAVTGSSGLVGSALVPFLKTGGYSVTRIVRGAPADGDLHWDPHAEAIDKQRLEGHEAVVHLAGENIAARRWNTIQKERIRNSRVQPTRFLCATLANLQRPPRVLISASAVGFYGSRGDVELNEQSPHGSGFLSEVCRKWEAATDIAAKAGIRVVRLRFGVILSPKAGALAKMLTPFRLGIGGRIGSGRQWMSWIALDDVLGCMYHALATDSVVGPVNAVAPSSVTNAQFTKTLGKVLRRPTLLPMPSPLARLALGEMADELLLGSTRAVPELLRATGFTFHYGDLEPALRHMLGKA